MILLKYVVDRGHAWHLLIVKMTKLGEDEEEVGRVPEHVHILMYQHHMIWLGDGLNHWRAIIMRWRRAKQTNLPRPTRRNKMRYRYILHVGVWFYTGGGTTYACPEGCLVLYWEKDNICLPCGVFGFILGAGQHTLALRGVWFYTGGRTTYACPVGCLVLYWEKDNICLPCGVFGFIQGAGQHTLDLGGVWFYTGGRATYACPVGCLVLYRGQDNIRLPCGVFGFIQGAGQHTLALWGVGFYTGGRTTYACPVGCLVLYRGQGNIRLPCGVFGFRSCLYYERIIIFLLTYLCL